MFSYKAVEKTDTFAKTNAHMPSSLLHLAELLLPPGNFTAQPAPKLQRSHRGCASFGFLSFRIR